MMKAKTENTKPNPMPATRCQRPDKREHKCETRILSTPDRFSHYAFCLLCFLVFVRCLSVSLKGAEVALANQDVLTGEIAMANSEADVDEKSSLSSFIVAPKPSSQATRQLWRSRITVLGSEEDKKSRNELKRLIEQIRSVRFEPKKQTRKPIISVGSVAAVEPNEALSTTELSGQTKEKEVELGLDNRLPYEPVSDQTLQKLGSISQHPDQVPNPLGLAEVLFLSGHLKQAATVYEQALRQMSPDDVGSAHDRAWVLFQAGNCLRDDDLPKAANMYRQLITEYPNSPWTDLAKARTKLIDWYQKDNPRASISEYGAAAPRESGP